MDQLWFGGNGLVEVQKQGFDIQGILARGVGDGVKRGDVAADAL